MKPRLQTSKKWTSFPKEYIDQITEVFNENFEADLDGAKIIVDGRIYPEEIMLRVGFLETGRIKQNNFELSMNYSQEEQDTIDRIYNCIDAAAALIAEFFESGENMELPYSWRPMELEGKSLFFQFSTENTDLEKQANQFLGQDEEALLNEDLVSDDALTRVEQTLEDEATDEDYWEDEDDMDDESDDDELPPTPTTLSGKKKKVLH